MFKFIKSFFRWDAPKLHYIVISHFFDSEVIDFMARLSIEPSRVFQNTHLYYINEETATILRLKFKGIQIRRRQDV